MTNIPSSPRIPIHTCEGLFKKVQWDYKQLEQDWGEYQAFNFIVTAYHLYADWIDATGTREQKQRKNKLPEIAQHLFFVLRDLANASKHWKLDSKAQSKQVVNDVTDPLIGDWYSYFVAGPVIYIETNGASPSLPEFSTLVVKSLEWILESKINEFPSELESNMQQILKPHH